MKKGESTGGENREVLIAFDRHRAGKTMREIAEDLYGVPRVAGKWDAEDWLRWRTGRLLQLLQLARTHGERA